MIKPVTTPHKPDLALQHWMDAEITLKTHKGQHEEKLTVEQFAYIIKRINEMGDKTIRDERAEERKNGNYI